MKNLDRLTAAGAGALLAFGTLVAAPSVAAQDSSPSAAQADAYLGQATSPPSLALLTSALELAPGDSEVLLARARALASDRTMTAAAIADLRSALSSGTWRSSTPGMAQEELADLLLRNGRAREALPLLEPLASRSPEDPRLLLLLARAEDGAGTPAAADHAVASALQAFPLDEGIRLFAAGRLERLGRRAAALALVSTGLKLAPSSSGLLLASVRLSSGTARTAAVDASIAAGGTDPLAPLVGMEASAKDRAKYLPLFLAHGGLSRQDLVDRAVAAVKSDTALAKTLRDALSSYSGVRDLDANSDGSWEERWTFQGGQATSWRSEPGQDGIAQRAATFQAGVPVSYEWRDAAGVEYIVTYSRYPAVESVTTGRTTYLLTPYVTSLPFLAPEPAGTAAGTGLAPRLAARPSVPSLEALRAAAYSEVDRDERGAVVRTATLLQGRPTYSEEDTDGDGVMDHRVWYSGGIPVRGDLLLQGGGRALDTWSQGRLVARESDTNGNGKIDYREQYGAVVVRTWDYNEDGIPDARETPGTGTTVTRELSTRLDGVFDVRVTWKDARITGVTRAGVALPVTTDATRGVTWIGAVPAPGLAPDATAGDGLQVIGDREYFVFHYDSVLYAEAAR